MKGDDSPCYHFPTGLSFDDHASDRRKGHFQPIVGRDSRGIVRRVFEAVNRHNHRRRRNTRTKERTRVIEKLFLLVRRQREIPLVFR